MVSESDDGPYFVSRDITLKTIGGSYVLSEGSRVTVNEGLASRRAVALMMQLKRAVALTLRALKKRSDISDNEVYKTIVNSQSFQNLTDIVKSQDMQEVESNIVAAGINPAEDMETIAQALENAGEFAVSKYIRRVAPRGKLGRIWQWMNKIAGTDEKYDLKAKKQPKEQPAEEQPTK